MCLNDVTLKTHINVYKIIFQNNIFNCFFAISSRNISDVALLIEKEITS